MRKKSQDFRSDLCYNFGMELAEGLLRALDLIEEELTEPIDFEKVASAAHYSRFHFARLFSAAFCMTPGEYVRFRRLSLAGRELAAGKKTLETALKYGYESPESFGRAFFRFHGVLPSKAKGAPLRFQRKLRKTDIYQGDPNSMQNCTIRQTSALTLVGFRKRFHGVPFGDERFEQESEFFSSTRAKQWLLIGACPEKERGKDYCAVLNADEEGYDFFLGYALDEWTRKALFDPAISGVDFLDRFGFETLCIPAALCAVFETERQDKFYPVRSFAALRTAIVSYLPENGFVPANAPELCIYHGRGEARYVEIRMPVEKP